MCHPSNWYSTFFSSHKQKNIVFYCHFGQVKSFIIWRPITWHWNLKKKLYLLKFREKSNDIKLRNNKSKMWKIMQWNRRKTLLNAVHLDVDDWASAFFSFFLSCFYASYSMLTFAHFVKYICFVLIGLASPSLNINNRNVQSSTKFQATGYSDAGQNITLPINEGAI